MHCAYTNYDELAVYRNQAEGTYGSGNVAMVDAGDTANVIPYIIAAVLAIAGIAVMLLRRKR